jgi:hypothetical protein
MTSYKDMMISYKDMMISYKDMMISYKDMMISYKDMMISYQDMEFYIFAWQKVDKICMVHLFTKTNIYTETNRFAQQVDK